MLHAPMLLAGGLFVGLGQRREHQELRVLHRALRGLRAPVAPVRAPRPSVFDLDDRRRLHERHRPRLCCQRHNIGVIVRVALDEGGLTGKITPDVTFAPDDFRNDYFGGDRKQQVYERVTRIASDLGISLDDMPETALRYTLSAMADDYCKLYARMLAVEPELRAFPSKSAEARP